jgi:hypothetical protein
MEVQEILVMMAFLVVVVAVVAEPLRLMEQPTLVLLVRRTKLVGLTVETATRHPHLVLVVQEVQVSKVLLEILEQQDQQDK